MVTGQSCKRFQVNSVHLTLGVQLLSTNGNRVYTTLKHHVNSNNTYNKQTNKLITQNNVNFYFNLIIFMS